MKYQYTCPVCEKGITFDCTPETPAKTYGPPENCYPAEGGDCDGPENCDQCGREINIDDVMQSFYDYYADNALDGPDPDDQRERDLENEREN